MQRVLGKNGAVGILGQRQLGAWGTVEYLKNNLSLIGVLIAVGALVVSILSLFTS